MLIIRRKPGEAVLIGDEVEIQIVEISPTRVKLGIQAPRTITVLRKELRHAGSANLAASRPFPAGAIDELVSRFRQQRPPAP